jgi:hypothetical protein
MISTQNIEKYYANKKINKKSLSKHYAHNRFLRKVTWELFFVKVIFGHLLHVQFSEKYF